MSKSINHEQVFIGVALGLIEPTHENGVRWQELVRCCEKRGYQLRVGAAGFLRAEGPRYKVWRKSVLVAHGKLQLCCRFVYENSDINATVDSTK